VAKYFHDASLPLFKIQAEKEVTTLVNKMLPGPSADKKLSIRVRVVTSVTVPKSALRLAGSGTPAAQKTIPLAKTSANARDIQLSPMPTRDQSSVDDEHLQLKHTRHAWILVKRGGERVNVWLRPQHDESHAAFKHLDGDYFQVSSHPSNWSGATNELGMIALQDSARLMIQARHVVAQDFHAQLQTRQEFFIENAEKIHDCSMKAKSSPKYPEHFLFEIKSSPDLACSL